MTVLGRPLSLTKIHSFEHTSYGADLTKMASLNSMSQPMSKVHSTSTLGWSAVRQDKIGEIPENTITWNIVSVF